MNKPQTGPMAGVRVNPWADRTPARPRPKPKPKPKVHPILMAARARRARRLKQLARMEASQEATA